MQFLHLVSGISATGKKQDQYEGFLLRPKSVSQHGCTDNACIRPKLGQMDRGGGHGLVQAVLGCFLADGIQQEAAGLTNAAAEHNHLRIQEVNNVGNGFAQVFDILME